VHAIVDRCKTQILSRDFEKGEIGAKRGKFAVVFNRSELFLDVILSSMPLTSSCEKSFIEGQQGEVC